MLLHKDGVTAAGEECRSPMKSPNQKPMNSGAWVVLSTSLFGAGILFIGINVFVHQFLAHIELVTHWWRPKGIPEYFKWLVFGHGGWSLFGWLFLGGIALAVVWALVRCRKEKGTDELCYGLIRTQLQLFCAVSVTGGILDLFSGSPPPSGKPRIQNIFLHMSDVAVTLLVGIVACLICLSLVYLMTGKRPQNSLLTTASIWATVADVVFLAVAITTVLLFPPGICSSS